MKADSVESTNGVEFEGIVVTADGKTVSDATIEVYIGDARTGDALQYDNTGIGYTHKVASTTTSENGKFTIPADWSLPDTTIAQESNFDPWRDRPIPVEGVIRNPLNQEPRVAVLAYKEGENEATDIEGPWFGSQSYGYNLLQNSEPESEIPVPLDKRIIRRFPKAGDTPGLATIWYQVCNDGSMELSTELRLREDSGYGFSRNRLMDEAGRVHPYYPTTDAIEGLTKERKRYRQGALSYFFPEKLNRYQTNGKNDLARPARTVGYLAPHERSLKQALALAASFVFDYEETPVPVSSVFPSAFKVVNGENEEAEDIPEVLVWAAETLLGYKSTTLGVLFDLATLTDSAKTIADLSEGNAGSARVTHNYGKPSALPDYPEPLEDVPTNPNTYDAETITWSTPKSSVILRSRLRVTEHTQIVMSGNWQMGDLWNATWPFELRPYNDQKTPEEA